MNTVLKEQAKYCTWFVEPADAETNRVIAENLPGENAHPETLCSDGVTRNLWECDWAFIARLERDKKSLRLKFLVFRKKGSHGKVESWMFT